MNTDTIHTRKVESGKMEKPGDFCFADDFSHLYIWLPGDTGPEAVRITRGFYSTPEPRLWGWNENEIDPPLMPSILTPDWHGFLKKGILESC